MKNAQAITRIKYPEARCILGHDPQDDTRLDYYFIVVDGLDEPILTWAYSSPEAWEEAARQIESEIAASTDPAVQLIASGAVDEHSTIADLSVAMKSYYSVTPRQQ